MHYSRFLILTLVLQICTAAAVPAAEKQVEWSTDIEGSLRRAASSGKPALLHFTASWCSYCRRMEQNTYSDSRVIARINSQFVPVKVDADRNRSLLKELGVQGLPAILVVSPELRPLKRIKGFQTSDALLGQLPTVPGARTVAASSQLPAASAAVRTAPENPATQSAPLPWPRRGVAAVNASSSESLPNSSVADYGAMPESAPAAAAQADDAPAAAATTANTAADGNPQPAERKRLFGDLFARVAARKQSEQGGQGGPGEQSGEGETADSPASGTVAFRGASLVTALEQRAVVRGSPHYQMRWRGNVLWFESETQLQKFAANPDQFWPMLNGICPMTLLRSGEKVQGELEYAALFRGRVWVFSSEADMREFLRDPAAVAAAVQ